MSRGELERLGFGPEPGQHPEIMGPVRFVAHCRGNAEWVLKNCKKLVETLLRLSQTGELKETVWKSSLPEWFVKQCPPARTENEAKAFDLLPLEERVRNSREARWSLKAFINAFTGERWWFWWDAGVTDRDTIFVDVESKDWPFPWDLLNQLLCASGATYVEADE